MSRIAQIGMICVIALATLPGSTAAQDETAAPTATPFPRLMLAPHPALDEIDQQFDPLWEEIQQRQQVIRQLTGQFWQGLETNGTGSPGMPTDQTVTWDQFLPLPPLTFSLQVDVYAGPHGDGYSVLLRHTTSDGQTWQRSIAYGLEPGRTWYWRPVVEDVLE